MEEETSYPHGGAPRTWLHASPGRNLQDILARGLEANRDGGNYGGYETSLDGVYVSRNATILGSHLASRDMEDHWLAVLVDLGPGMALVDEDVLDSLMDSSARRVLGEHGHDIRDVDGLLEADDPVWREVAAAFASALGPGEAEKGLAEEFASSWVLHHLYDEDVDPLWWAEAKDALVRAHRSMRHPYWGARFDSLRVPGHVGFDGPARVVGVVEVIDGVPRLAWGAVPEEDEGLVHSLVGGEPAMDTAPAP